MKYLLNDHGIVWFKKKLKETYFPYSILPMKVEPPSILKDYLGWHKQGEKTWFIGLPFLSGRLKGKTKKGLRQIVDTYKLEIRLTPNQDILLCNIGTYQKASINESLNLLGIETKKGPLPIERHALACPALPLCGLAITEAERSLPEVLKRIDVQLNRLHIHKPILIRMTGCPNGCSRPYMAELALVGSGPSHYQLWLGGTPDLKNLAKPYIPKMSLSDLESTIEPLLKSWAHTSKSCSLGEHVINLGDQAVMSLLATGIQAP